MKEKKIFGFTQNVFVLSLMSFLNDIGGETIKRTLPLFLTNVLGTKTPIVGLIEGVSDSTAQLVQPFSGYLSDKRGKRKPFVVIGQILRSAMVLFYFANSWLAVLLIRFSDRCGKGIANSPRDALLSESAEPAEKGKAFGLQRMMDNGGAVVGLFLAAFMVFLTNRNQNLLTEDLFRKIVLLVIIPTLLVFIILILFVKDIEGSGEIKEKNKLDFSWRKLNRNFKIFLLITFVFTLGNSSDAFLLLKVQKEGLPIEQLFLMLAAFSLVASVISIPAGKLSDKIGRKILLLAGWMIFILIYLGFAVLKSSQWLVVLYLIYGAYYGLTEGAAKALVADLVEPEHRGTAYGIYNLVLGLTLLPASLIAGFLWQIFSPAAPFLFGAGLAMTATAGMAVFLNLHKVTS